MSILHFALNRKLNLREAHQGKMVKKVSEGLFVVVVFSSFLFVSGDLITVYSSTLLSGEKRIRHKFTLRLFPLPGVRQVSASAAALVAAAEALTALR